MAAPGWQSEMLAACYDLASGEHRRRLAASEPVTLARGEVLWRSDEGPARGFVYFPDRGVVSVLVSLEDGSTADVGLVGKEGVIGAIEGAPAPFEALAVVPGLAWRLPREVFASVIGENPDVRVLIERYRAYRHFESINRAACTAFHTTRQRLSRTLLQLFDRVGRECRITHELLGLVLGVRRATVTVLLQALHQAGAVAERRGVIVLHDRAALERESCQCHAALRERLAQVYKKRAPPADSSP